MIANVFLSKGDDIIVVTEEETIHFNIENGNQMLFLKFYKI